MESGAKMLLNNAQIDWITLTTFDDKVAYDAYRSLNIDDGNDEKRMQYAGRATEYAFMGQALQNDRVHHMLQSSGEAAHYTAQSFVDRAATHYEWNCTRIDLQITIRLHPAYAARDVFDAIHKWDGPGRPRQVSIVQSGDGLDTIYIGNRQSDRFTRIYVKPLDDGTKVLRFEVEYKGDHAKTIWKEWTFGVDMLAEQLAHEVESLPYMPNLLASQFLTALGTHGRKLAVERVEGQNSTLDWLRSSVTPAIERLLFSHDTRHLMLHLLNNWNRLAE